MGNAANVKRTIKKSKVYSLMLLTFLAVSAIYGYLFYNQVEVEAIPALVDPNGPPKFSRMIYGGFGEEALKKPMDVAVIGQFIYVTDTNNHRVQVFDTGGTPIFKFGKQGDGPGEFQFPYGIAGDNKGNVYVADLYNGGISVHDSKGKFIKYFAEKKPAEKTIETPGGLRIIDNKVYVTDITKSKVYVFDMEGKKLLEIGKMGIKEGELRAPNAVTADKEGNIYVVDTGNQRVQVFDKKGKFLRIINGSPDGKGPSQFVNPRGIGIDSRGIVYVVSNLTHFVHGFDREGNQVFTFGGNGSANDQFSLPNGLFITENDEVLITDTVNQRIAVYE
ncbi:NHL repeat containing protein [Thermincola ferriacetica]|uniref:NHL repeat containing protein n=2 Tax=Thermincola ferriacetica TaxID=281456 RepID=A0A0L6W4Z5_9FIRM|nr:NHL repeat containing protein [Thermincola ferriacetica]